MNPEITLCPSQQAAFNFIDQGLAEWPILLLRGSGASGFTTVLRQLHAKHGGKFLTLHDYVEALSNHDPIAMEEAFLQLCLDAFRQSDLVFLDDLHRVTTVSDSCYGGAYPRPRFLDAVLEALSAYVAGSGKRLVCTAPGVQSNALVNRSLKVRIQEFTPADYRALCAAYLPTERVETLDFERIYRFARHLDVYDLKKSGFWLSRREGEWGTEGFIDYLRSQNLVSNVDLAEVQQVELRDLKGIEDVVESLEANIVVPLLEDTLAKELELRPKRGVLLAGPPGTGKTTVGRALAHRMKGKFFLIDGTVISGTGMFYQQVSQIFEAAKENAPAIIFIDDSDVIFESGEEHGLYRYLLTMLDGLESESVGDVCVMLTAMDVAAIPPALLRSGRIELWLEMRLPDEEARAAILQPYLERAEPIMGQVDLPALVLATVGFTGADLKRLVADAKNLYAYDRVKELPLQPADAYFQRAVASVRGNQERYAQAEAQVRAKRYSALREE